VFLSHSIVRLIKQKQFPLKSVFSLSYYLFCFCHGVVSVFAVEPSVAGHHFGANRDDHTLLKTNPNKSTTPTTNRLSLYHGCLRNPLKKERFLQKEQKQPKKTNTPLCVSNSVQTLPVQLLISLFFLFLFLFRTSDGDVSGHEAKARPHHATKRRGKRKLTKNKENKQLLKYFLSSLHLEEMLFPSIYDRSASNLT
jgi:hypothetical protein